LGGGICEEDEGEGRGVFVSTAARWGWEEGQAGSYALGVGVCSSWAWEGPHLDSFGGEQVKSEIPRPPQFYASNGCYLYLQAAAASELSQSSRADKC
jgi:hypothetical protein